MSKINNLKGHFKKKNEENLKLVESAINELEDIGSEISVTTVAKMSEIMALKSGLQKGLSKGALYKNSTYTDLIKKRKLLQQKGKGKKPNSLKDTSEGDLYISLFELREQNAKLQQKNKILQDTLKHFEDKDIGVFHDKTSIADSDNSLELKQIIITLYKNDLIVFDGKTSDMRLAAYGDLLITYESAVKIIGKDFVDDLRTHKSTHVY